jgi:hypothetical protein
VPPNSARTSPRDDFRSCFAELSRYLGSSVGGVSIAASVCRQHPLGADTRTNVARPSPPDSDDLDPANPISKPAHDHNEYSGEQGGNRHRDIHRARVETEIFAHVGSDIQRRLSEQPEGDNTEDDAAEQLIVALKPRRCIGLWSHITVDEVGLPERRTGCC